MKTKGTIFFAVLITALINLTSKAQTGIGTRSPNSNSILDLSSTNKGLLLPRVELTSTTSFLPLTAHVSGMIIYNTATTTTGSNDVTPGYYFNDGTKWVRAINTASSSGWGLAGNATTSAGTNFIGTTDAQDLVFKTAGVENFRINQKGRLITSSTFPAVNANSLYIGNAGNDTQLAGAIQNTALGYQTMNALTDGSENTAVGNQALNLLRDGIGNSAFGVQSLNRSVSTIANTGFGYQSLFNVTGSSNTALGANAGYHATNALTRDNNTFLGNGATYAAAGASTITKSTAVGAGVVLTNSNTVILGTTTEKVGVGLTNPSNALHVKATADPLKLERLQTGNAGDMMLTVGTDGVVKRQAYPGLLISKFVTASYTVLPEDYLIIVTQPTPAAALTVTLPRADLNYGRVINISNFANGASSPVTIRSFSGVATQLKTGTTGAVATALLEPADGTVASGKGKST
jgi:hypothetical protein